MGHIVHAYVRVSTEDQTIEQQKTAIRDSYQPNIELSFYEENESGWKGRRPEWEALKQGIVRGRVKEVCAFSISRLGRSCREAWAFLDMTRQMGCTIKIVTLPLDFNGPFSTGIFMLMAELAQMESDMKSFAIKAKFRQKRKDDPSWRMHGNVKDTVSKKMKSKAPEVYRMLADGKSQKYVSDIVGLMEHSIGKLVKLQGKQLMTRQDYAAAFPGWHLVPIDERPAIPDAE